MLLTLADGQGTSAEGWSDWKERLVWQLYHSTSQYLADQAGFHEQQKVERESLQRAVLDQLSPDYEEELEAHLDFMPDNYFRAFEVEEIAGHARLFRKFLARSYLSGTNPLAPAISWRPFAQEGHSTVSFCTWDGQQLLAKIAGSFSVVPLNILSADIYTRGDNVVLDIFRVCDLKARAVTNEKEIALVEATLQRALADQRFDFGPLLAKAHRQVPSSSAPEFGFPTKIITDNKSHPNYTLVQIATPDRIGLLYDLLSVFGAEGVSIALSRISTEKGAATDTFYVVDSLHRGKITNAERVQALQQKLQQAALGGR
jgi:[protein-PII] uridylyltransferase